MPKTRYVRQAKKECSLDREAASQSRSTSPTISIDRKIHKSPFAVDPSSPMPLTEAQMTAEIKFLRRNLVEIRKISKLERDNYEVTMKDQREEILKLKEDLKVKNEFIKDLTAALDVKDKEKEKLQKKHGRLLKTKEDKISSMMSQMRDIDSQRNNAQQFVQNIGRKNILIARAMTRMVQRVLMTCSITTNSIVERFHRDIARTGSISHLADTLIKLINLKKDDIPAGEELEERNLLEDLLNLFSVLFFIPTIRGEISKNNKYPEFLKALTVFIFEKNEESLFVNDPGILEGCCKVLDETCKTDVGINTLSQYETSEGCFYELLVNYIENASERCNDAQVNYLLNVFFTVSTNEAAPQMNKLIALFKQESLEKWEKSSNEALRTNMERYLRIGLLVKLEENDSIML
ncbi:unnamed protein product [Oikopleura dioica]|uniref:Uncharacterized protein n=1 Tax=Oikopleura dioica TaxID=34765 RepID=E4XCV2_OIKDI|nr:unnamed protein product [Oikopleura dioica]